MNELLFVDPWPFLAEQYARDKRVAMFSRATISAWKDNTEQRYQYAIDYPSEICSEIDISKIRSRIDWLMPLFYRWVGESADYEVDKRTCLLYVVKIVQLLSRIKPRYAIFSAGVAHHIEISLVELACQLTNTKQIYFYPSPFGVEPMLIPILQTTSLWDRQILDLELGAYDPADDLDMFIKNHGSGAPPIHNDKIGFRSTSLPYACVLVVMHFSKQIIRSIIGRKSHDSWHYINISSEYSWLSLFKVLFKQRRAMQYYQSCVSKGLEVKTIIAEAKLLPILYAHYQPESTTFPEGGDITNNIDLIIDIRKSGYQGPILYKEHPASWAYHFKSTGFSKVGLYRSVEYFRQLESLGCVFVDTKFKMQDSYLDKLFPVTMTGSVAIERSLMGLVTCCSGLPWFKGMPGTYSIRESFGVGGVFSNSSMWKFDSISTKKWFEERLSLHAITNFPGVGTGIKSKDQSQRVRFLSEIGKLLDGLGCEKNG